MTLSVRNNEKWDLGARLKSGVRAFRLTTQMNWTDLLNPELTLTFLLLS